MVGKLKAGTSFPDVAGDAGLKGGPPSTCDDSPANLPAKVGQDIFRTPKGTAGERRATRDRTDRIHVTEVRSRTRCEVDQRKAIADVLQHSFPDDVTAEYVSRLENELGVTVNQSP